MSGPDETPLRVHKALSHSKISVFGMSGFGIFKNFLLLEFLFLVLFFFFIFFFSGEKRRREKGHYHQAEKRVLLPTTIRTTNVVQTIGNKSTLPFV